MLFVDVTEVERYRVYQYQHLDDLNFLQSPDVFFAHFEHFAPKNPEAWIAAVTDRFKRAGWEGDGDIQIMWLPPFILSGDTYGSYHWVVKQSNNGTAFITGKEALPFPMLLEQNRS
ncbi:hypothetical protein ACIQC9_06660 [Brevundimonas sp. NPDC092305]|uniref:hypothetical protein n=1 Tax=Brevundimonas sp. NPDC092305 TaxID=3363957 RepID=UPI0037FD3D18